LANLYNLLGYFTRFHITIYPTQLRNQATDIDVYAIRYSSQLVPSVYIVEAMGKGDSVSEVFRMYGFKSYFRNCDAILVSDRIDALVLDTAKKLGLKAFSLARLRELTANDVDWARRKQRPHVPISISDAQRVLGFLKTIKTLDEQLFWVYHYLWLENNPYLKLLRLHDLSERCSKFLKATREEDAVATSWYLKEIMMLSLLSCIEIAADCIDLLPTQLNDYLADRFYNLGTSKESKMRIKDSIQVLVDTIRELSQGKIKIPDVEIVPSYLSDLAQTVKLVIENAPFIQTYVLLDEMIYRKNLQSVSKNIREVAFGDTQRNSIVKLNASILKVLHGSSVPSIFNDFV